MFTKLAQFSTDQFLVLQELGEPIVNLALVLGECAVRELKESELVHIVIQQPMDQTVSLVLVSMELVTLEPLVMENVPPVNHYFMDQIVMESAIAHSTVVLLISLETEHVCVQTTDNVGVIIVKIIATAHMEFVTLTLEHVPHVILDTMVQLVYHVSAPKMEIVSMEF